MLANVQMTPIIFGFPDFAIFFFLAKIISPIIFGFPDSAITYSRWD